MTRYTSPWLKTLNLGFVFGGSALFVALVGLISAFLENEIVSGVVSLGQFFLLGIAVFAGFIVARQYEEADLGQIALYGAIIAAVTGLTLGIFLLFGTQTIPLWLTLLIVGAALAAHNAALRLEADDSRGALVRAGIIGAVTLVFILIAVTFPQEQPINTIFVNANDALFSVLSFGLPTVLGAVVITGAYTALGAGGALLTRMNDRLRRAIFTGLMVVTVVGVLRDLIFALLAGGPLEGLGDFLFASGGLTIPGALILLVLGIGLSLAGPGIQQAGQPAREWFNEPGREVVKYGLLVAILAALAIIYPQLAQLYLSDVTTTIGLYVLMGIGLNIVLGYAGLLDLGQAGFFAIGAYTVALLTSPSASMAASPELLATMPEALHFLLPPWSFWAALPVAMFMAALAGILLGIPVLRMRGDYLAIVTLGLSEIIRIFVTSEAFKGFLGGPQGVLNIPKPTIFGVTLSDAQALYYVVLLMVLVAAFVSWRLNDSRVGRAWIAMREDQDVAEAMGINIVYHKLLAFAFGALFAGMAGAVFAAKLGSVFPQSFGLLVSINVVSVIIVGGMGSIPGVVVGALILVGLPEILREFSDFRLMLYGALLVVMMLTRPEGFVPAQQRRRELTDEQSPSEEPSALRQPSGAD